jgi:hypothetical protein
MGGCLRPMRTCEAAKALADFLVGVVGCVCFRPLPPPPRLWRAGRRDTLAGRPI